MAAHVPEISNVKKRAELNRGLANIQKSQKQLWDVDTDIGHVDNTLIIHNVERYNCNYDDEPDKYVNLAAICGDVFSAINTLAKQIESLDGRLNNLNAKIDRINSKKTDLNSQVKSLHQDVEIMDHNLRSLRETLTFDAVDD